MIDTSIATYDVLQMMDALEKSCLPNVAYNRVGAPDPSCNLKTMLKIVYPTSGSLSKLATFSNPHIPAPKNI